MTTSDTYNGWANRETWALNLMLSNDEGLYEMTQERVADALSTFQTGNDSASGPSDDDRALIEHRAGEAVQQLFDELTDLAEGLLSPVQVIELLREVGSVWRIDWRESGAAWLENLS
jgi:hypothetical protein